ncbi:MAG: methyltransferase domain-containing protein [Elusimicrobia bacterium]|nr:methyltransferase domain-containing protein [Elusimicrobiota bacterium]
MPVSLQKTPAIGDLILGYRGAKVLFTAAKLDLFSRLDGKAAGARELARSLGTDIRATGIMLDSLCALGFLRKRGAGYANTPLSRKALVRGSPYSLLDNLCYQDDLWSAWSGLGSVLRKGRPDRSLRGWITSRTAFGRDYIRGMQNISREPARELAGRVACPPGAWMLDVGAGSGAYSAAFLRRNPSMTAVLLDLPSTLKHARAVLAEQPEDVRRRIRLRPGDYHTAPFGRGSMDLVLLSHVTHDEGEADNLRLLRKARQALRPGGRVVIHDFMLRPDRTGPLFGALFSVHMLTYTRKGRVYTTEEYRQWLEGLGFAGIRCMDIAKGATNGTQAMVGVKR